MATRRGVLAGLAGVALLRGTVAAAARGAGAGSQEPAPGRARGNPPTGIEVPPGACDCHTHVIGDPRRFPMAASRTYTPQQASVEDLRALHRALGIERVVIVQPSVYGTDNACTLDALRQIGPSARGIAVVDDRAPASALDEMEAAGIRGIRINLATAGQTDPDVARRRLEAAVQRIGGRRWHIQMYATLPVISAIRAQLEACPVPLVFDHFGGARAAGGTDQPGFDVLLDLIASNRAWVKMSAPYRGSSLRPAYADMGPLATALVARNRRRVLWGSDWPHPDTSAAAGRSPRDVSPHLPIDDAAVLAQLPGWAGDRATLKTILVDNPAALYGF